MVSSIFAPSCNIQPGCCQAPQWFRQAGQGLTFDHLQSGSPSLISAAMVLDF